MWSLVASSLGAFALAAPVQPVLPTMWISTTDEPGMGKGVESYYFVDEPSATNPSSMWSNYTDCQRLIHADGSYEYTRRYLLGCDAVDCCWEEQDGNQVEFQIPNVHPASLAPVTFGGRQNITTSFGHAVEADTWTWKFGPESWIVYTNACETCVNNVTIYRWYVSVLGVEESIDFDKDYQGIPESQRAAFAAT